MKKYLFLVLATLLTGGVLSAQSGFFGKTDAFLKKNVSNGGVDYASIKSSPAELNALVGMIASYPLSAKDKNTQKAFYLNAYNILVIKNVVNHYPIAKPLDVPGFFDAKKFKIAGMNLTLSDIENKKIRPTFKDARVHFALVCAARSCPPIAAYAFVPSKVNTQLEAITKKALNRNSFIKVSNDKKTVQLSQILDWYKEDFLAEAKSVLAYVNKYRTTPIPSSYKQSFYTYNWALNVKKK
ncbi:MAG: DUF547 domain-containing protein [Bacteroidota bacterium]